MPEKYMADVNQLIPKELIERRIFVIRGQKVMIDSDLAELYELKTKVLNQAVTRNKERFPEDFMFRLNTKEWEDLNRSQFVTSSQKHRGQKFLPRVFTQEGIAMLSGILKSQKAVEINIAIMRAFVRLREFLATHKELAAKINEHDQQIAYLFDQMQKLLEPPKSPKKNPVGFITPNDDD